MRFCFDTLDEVKDFVKQLKGTRGGKDKDEPETGGGGGTVTAPPPQMPPPNPGAFTGGSPAFAPPAPGAGQGTAFPAPAAGPVVDPAVTDLVRRLTVRLDCAVASGQPVEAVL